jgi:hypothetical protein
MLSVFSFLTILFLLAPYQKRRAYYSFTCKYIVMVACVNIEEAQVFNIRQRLII